MKIVILFFLLRGAIDQDSLPPRAELFATLRTFHAETADANAQSLNVSDKYKWLHWMPSIGVTLGKPTVGFSLSQVAQNIEAKAQRTAERSKILRGANIAFRSDSFALVALCERYATLADGTAYMRQVELIENQRFTILRDKYAAKEITPLEWFDAQSANLRTGEALNRRLEEIKLLEIEIYRVAKY